MIKVGLTGGYATGKTFVASQFERLGCHIIHADRLGHEALEPSGESFAPVVQRFGRGILSENGAIDRKKLSRIVFEDEKRLKELTELVHPAVYRREEQLLADWAERDPNGIAIVEAAILVETGRYAFFDRLVLTFCDQVLQIERGMKRDGLTRAEILARLSRQLPFAEKKQHSHFVIDTGGTKDETARFVADVHSQLLRLAKDSTGDCG